MPDALTPQERITETVTSWPGVQAGPGRRGEFAFTVGGNTDEGWVFAGNGNQSGGKVLAAASVAPVMRLNTATSWRSGRPPR